MTCRPRARAVGLAILVLLLVVVPAAGAFAHASFVSATPAPGAGMPQGPDQVVMRFSEPLVRGPSRIRVIDATGDEVTKGDTLPVEGDAKAMRRKLAILPPGIYTVRWTTVSPIDGHTLKGSYKFAVGATTVGDATLQAGPVDSEGWLGLFGRYVALAGLGLWLGFALLDPVLARREVAGRTRRLVARWAPAAVAVGTLAALVSTALVSTGDLSGLGAITYGSRSGLLRLASAGIALVGVATARRRPVALGLATVAVVLEAASGHAGASATPAVAIPMFAIHLGAVGVWGAAITAALTARGRIREALTAVAPAAIGAGIAVALTGAGAATLELTGFADLLGTAYGKVVTAKIVGILIVAGLGAAHHLRRRHGDHSPPRLRRPVAGELAAIAVVLGLATALVGFPNPPADVNDHDTSGGVQSALDAAAAKPALSLAQASGPYIVGLTLNPPTPGRVGVLVQLLAVEAGDAPRDATFTATGPNGAHEQVDLQECGSACFNGEATLDATGDWTIDVSVATNRGDATLSTTVPLPATDGTKTFAAMLAAMNQASSVQVHETLRVAETADPIVSEYSFAAPDEMRWEVVSGGSTRIALGDTGYVTTGNDNEGWKKYPWPGDGFSWPSGFYRSFFTGARAFRIVGHETIDGHPTDVLTMVQPDYPAWYRIWIDTDTHRILKLQMRATQHIMNHTYSHYDAPVDIHPPADATPATTSQGN